MVLDGLDCVAQGVSNVVGIEGWEEDVDISEHSSTCRASS